MLQQELETWELYAGNPWDVDEQNSGWYYLGVLVNKQIWLIKAGRPQRFLPPSADSTLYLAVMGISGFTKGQVGNECLRSCFTCDSAPGDRDIANLEEGCPTMVWYSCHLVRCLSPAVSKCPSCSSACQLRELDCLLTQRGWHTNTLHRSAHLTVSISGAQAAKSSLQTAAVSWRLCSHLVLLHIQQAGYLPMLQTLPYFFPTHLPAWGITFSYRSLS